MAAVTGELQTHGVCRGRIAVDACGLLSDAIVAAKAQVMALVSAELAVADAAGPGARLARRRNNGADARVPAHSRVRARRGGRV